MVLRHRRETCGHGKNSTDRGYQQPSPKGMSAFVLMSMDAVQRLNGSRLQLWFFTRTHNTTQNS